MRNNPITRRCQSNEKSRTSGTWTQDILNCTAANGSMYFLLGGTPIQKGKGCSSFVLAVKKRFWYLSKVHSESYCATFKALNRKCTTGDNVLLKNWYFLRVKKLIRGSFQNTPRAPPSVIYGSSIGRR